MEERPVLGLFGQICVGASSACSDKAHGPHSGMREVGNLTPSFSQRGGGGVCLCVC